jgi:hypothetical protein
MSIKDEYPIGTVLEFTSGEPGINPGTTATVIGHHEDKASLFLDFGQPIETNKYCGWFPYLHAWRILNQIKITNKISLPKNNDGRNDCAFCGAPTRKAGEGKQVRVCMTSVQNVENEKMFIL